MRRAIFAKIKVAATHATFGQCERLANVDLTNYFRRTEKNPLLRTYHYAQSFFLAPKIITMINLRTFVSQNKAQNAGCSRKNAGITSKCGISRTIAVWLTPMSNEEEQNESISEDEENEDRNEEEENERSGEDVQGQTSRSIKYRDDVENNGDEYGDSGS